MTELITEVPGISAPLNSDSKLNPVVLPKGMDSNPQNSEGQDHLRLERVFQPFPSTESARELPDDYYAYLLNYTEQRISSVEDAAVRESKAGIRVSEKTQADAEHVVGQLVGRSGLLGEFLSDYMIAKGIPSRGDLVRAVHEDLDVRVGLGRLFLNMLEIRSNYMLDRIRRNTQKVSAIPCYSERGPLSSREYVALLALAKLDGTYDKDREREPVSYNPDGSVRDGQHRWAADELLFH